MSRHIIGKKDSLGTRRGLFAKVDNQAHGAKVDIRKRVVAALARDIYVFDAFAGAGSAMYDAVWSDAEYYVGCDLKWERDTGRTLFVGDNRRVMRAIDLKKFNVFDLDAYGFPWEQALIIADRRPVKPGEAIGLIITEGGGIAYKANSVPHAVSILARVRHGAVGLGRRREDIVDRCLAGLARRMRCKIEKRWQATGRSGATMLYVGVVLRGIGGSANTEQMRTTAEDQGQDQAGERSPT
jgi:hypothetical protein